MEKLESVHFPKVLRMRLACALLKLNQFRVSPAVKFLFLGSCFCFSLSLSLSLYFFAFVFSFCAVWGKTSGNHRESTEAKRIERKKERDVRSSSVVFSILTKINKY